MRRVELLAELQRVEVENEHAEARLAEVKKKRSDHSELQRATGESERARRQAQRLAAEQRDLELQVEAFAGRIKTLEQKLYGGSLRNPKELHDLSKDVDQIRRQRSSVEDRLLECLERAEVASRALEEAVATLDLARRRHDQEQEALAREDESLRARLTELAATREGLRSEADRQDLRLYDSLRQSRGLAVVEVRQRTCQGCQVGLTLHDDMRARSSDAPVVCQSCGRMLYAMP